MTHRAGWRRTTPATGSLSNLALRIRYGEIEIRHGATVEGLGRYARRSTSRWRHGTGGGGPKATRRLRWSPGFRADLRAAGAVLRAAKPYLKDDPLHRRLLAERGGIAAADLEELADRQRRGRSIRDMSIGERRGADPGFVPAPPARRPEEVRVAAIGRALDALEPAGASHDIPVDADVDIDPHIHADTFDRGPMPEPPADLWEGRERMYDRVDTGPEAEIDQDEPVSQSPAAPDPARRLHKAPRRPCRRRPGRGNHPFEDAAWPELAGQLPGFLARDDLSDRARHVISGCSGVTRAGGTSGWTRSPISSTGSTSMSSPSSAGAGTRSRMPHGPRSPTSFLASSRATTCPTARGT